MYTSIFAHLTADVQRLISEMFFKNYPTSSEQVVNGKLTSGLSVKIKEIWILESSWYILLTFLKINIFYVIFSGILNLDAYCDKC